MQIVVPYCHRINGKELSGLMRYMGVIMTDAEVMDMIRQCGGLHSTTNRIEFNFLNRNYGHH